MNSHVLWPGLKSETTGLTTGIVRQAHKVNPQMKGFIITAVLGMQAVWWLRVLQCCSSQEVPVEPNRQAEDSGDHKEAILCTLQAEEGCSAPR
jgi:hypothetical protein